MSNDSYVAVTVAVCALLCVRACSAGARLEARTEAMESFRGAAVGDRVVAKAPADSLKLAGGDGVRFEVRQCVACVWLWLWCCVRMLTAVAVACVLGLCCACVI